MLLLECISFYSWSPTDFSPHAGVSRFLPPSRHLSRSCASSLCKPLAIMSHSSTSFHFLFSFPFFDPSASKYSALLGLFLYPFSIYAVAIANFVLSETLPIFPHPPSHEFHCVFYPSRSFHISPAAFSFLWSLTFFHLLLSMLNGECCLCMENKLTQMEIEEISHDVNDI